MMPSWRKPAGVGLIILLIIIWAAIVASFSGIIGQLPGLVQIPVYIIAGIIWILPLKPLLKWMETGRWR